MLVLINWPTASSSLTVFPTRDTVLFLQSVHSLLSFQCIVKLSIEERGKRSEIQVWKYKFINY